MKIIVFILSVFLTLNPFQFSHAAVEPDYDPSKPRIANLWYGETGHALKKADLGFIAGMRPHHAGALTMSQEYLDSAGAVNGPLKQLARGIIHNQTFEIGMLDTVEKLLAANGDKTRGPIAIKGLAQKQRFTRMPMPGILNGGPDEASAEDVRFAKAMIVHHQAALTMAGDYLANPDTKNGYLRLMCLDILFDQSQEIAFMQSIIALYPGNPDDIKIAPSMVHGMDGMNHHHQHSTHHSQH